MERKMFLATSAGVIGGPMVANAATPGATAGSPASWSRSQFEAVLAQPYRHRQVFASTKIDDANVLHFMKNSLSAYATQWADGPGTLHVAAVLYGGLSVVLGLDDAAWDNYKVGAYLAKNSSDALSGQSAAASGNPFRGAIADLVAGGAHFFVCDNALRGAAGHFGPPADVHADLLNHFLPGAMLVPAGVAALNAAQEAHFTLVQASCG